jgi:uncharacterized membrane protein
MKKQKDSRRKVRIRNPFLLNDWEIRRTLLVVFIVQAAVLIVSCFAFLGFYFPIVQVPISFVYLTFIPGILLLRTLKLHELGDAKTLLYSMGLSLCLLMAVGFVMNTFLPVIGVTDPISFVHLVVILTSIVLVLCALSFIRDKDFSNPVYVNIAFGTMSPQILLLCLLPFLTIFATFLMNIYSINSLQMLLLLIIMAIPFAVVFGRIPQKNYAFLVFVISFSLLFHTALISQYIWGPDVNSELVLSRLVLQSGFWDATIPVGTNGMLSIVMLAPIYSLFLNISLPWVFKTVYPFIFSFVPLGLFTVYRKPVGDKIGFLSCFYFMAYAAFYVEMPTLARQSIAEVFLVLIMLVIVESSMRARDRSLLLLIFGAALVVSHYGTAYIFLIVLALALPITYIALPKVFNATKTSNMRTSRSVTVFTAFFAVCTFAWYMYVGSSATFDKAVTIGDSITSNISSMFDPSVNQPLEIITRQFGLLPSIERYLVPLSLVFVAFGLLATLLDRKTEFTREYLGLACGSFVFLILAAVLPFLASQMNSDRVITLCLFFLAPFCIIGLIRLLGLFSSSTKYITKQEVPRESRKTRAYLVVSIFLVIWVLFNSAFIYQLFDQPKVGRFALDNNVDFQRLNDQELASATWLATARQNSSSITYADVNKAYILYGILGHAINLYVVNLELGYNFTNCYVFLGTYNLNTNTVFVGAPAGSPVTYVSTHDLLPDAGVIFDNGGSQILLAS